MRFTPGFSSKPLSGLTVKDRKERTASSSAGGAREYSPEWSAAELRDPSRIDSTPAKGWRRTAPHHHTSTVSVAPLAGAFHLLTGLTGVPLRSTPGSSSNAPSGLTVKDRKERTESCSAGGAKDYSPE
jgi:hypothetical protein